MDWEDPNAISNMTCNPLSSSLAEHSSSVACTVPQVRVLVLDIYDPNPDVAYSFNNPRNTVDCEES